MTTIKRISNDEILALNKVRKRPCITESGDCYIITAVRVYDDGEVYRIDSVHDTNVLATEREARAFIARMTLDNDDACSSVKTTYTVRCHNVF